MLVLSRCTKIKLFWNFNTTKLNNGYRYGNDETVVLNNTEDSVNRCIELPKLVELLRINLILNQKSNNNQYNSNLNEMKIIINNKIIYIDKKGVLPMKYRLILVEV